MALETDRIYEVLDPKEPPKPPPTAKRPSLTRSKTIGPTSVSRFNGSNGHGGYAVPRSIMSTTPPISHPPPAVPPRNRNCSEGDISLAGSPNDRFLRGGFSGSPNDRGFSLPRNGIMGTSPTDRGITLPGRRTPSTGSMSKSPSILSVSSNALEELLLLDFMTKYSKSLPLRVKVCKGFYGVSDQTAVTTGDIFNFHFMKNTKVVVVETKEGTRLSIPLNSSIMASLLYDPHDNMEEALAGFKFDTVGEICAMKALPKVVRATRAFQGSSSENSVSEHELLVVKSTKSKLTGKQLRVYSITAGKKKVLSENCTGRFSTAPADVKLHFYEITMHVQEVFPYKAVLALPDGSFDGVLNDLHCATVTLKKALSESSVIATSALDDDMGEQPETAEMPVDLDIEVEAMALDENELEHLRQDTSHMYESFDPYSVCLYMTKATKRLYDIQCLLYQTVMTGTQFRGLEILRPSTISQPVQTSKGKDKTYQPLNKDQVATGCTDYYVIMQPNSIQADQPTRDSPDHSNPTTNQTNNDSSDQSSGDSTGQSSGESNTSHLSLLEVHHKAIEKRVDHLFEENQRMTKEITHLRRFCESLQTQLRMVQAEAMTESRPPVTSPTLSDGEYDMVHHSDGPSSDSGSTMNNHDFLITLNYKQVLTLLEALGLKQYHDTFKEEKVSGEILSECDEEVLTNDLGIKSKLHRIKLMKVITGRHSAKRIMAGEDPYAHKAKQQSSETAAH